MKLVSWYQFRLVCLLCYKVEDFSYCYKCCCDISLIMNKNLFHLRTKSKTHSFYHWRFSNNCIRVSVSRIIAAFILVFLFRHSSAMFLLLKTKQKLVQGWFHSSTKMSFFWFCFVIIMRAVSWNRNQFCIVEWTSVSDFADWCSWNMKYAQAVEQMAEFS